MSALTSKHLEFAAGLENVIYGLFQRVSGDIFTKLRRQIQQRKLHVMFEPELNCDPKTDHLLSKDVLPLFDQYIGNAESLFTCTFKLILQNTVKDKVAELPISDPDQTSYLQDEINYLYIQLAAAQRIITKQTKEFADEKAKLKQQIISVKEQLYITNMGNQLYCPDNMKEFAEEAKKNPKLQQKLLTHVMSKRSKDQDSLLQAELALQRNYKEVGNATILPEQKEIHFNALNNAKQDVDDYEAEVEKINKEYQQQIDEATARENQLLEELRQNKLDLGYMNQEMNITKEKLKLAEKSNTELETHIRKLGIMQKKIDAQNSKDGKLNIELNELEARRKMLGDQERNQLDEVTTDFQYNFGTKLNNQKQALAGNSEAQFILKEQLSQLAGEKNKILLENDALKQQCRDLQNQVQKQLELQNKLTSGREMSRTNLRDQNDSKVFAEMDNSSSLIDGKRTSKSQKSKKLKGQSDYDIENESKVKQQYYDKSYSEAKILEQENLIQQLRSDIQSLQIQLNAIGLVSEQDVQNVQEKTANEIIREKTKGIVITNTIKEQFKGMSGEDIIQLLQQQLSDYMNEHAILKGLLQQLGFSIPEGQINLQEFKQQNKDIINKLEQQLGIKIQIDDFFTPVYQDGKISGYISKGSDRIINNQLQMNLHLQSQNQLLGEFLLDSNGNQIFDAKTGLPITVQRDANGNIISISGTIPTDPQTGKQINCFLNGLIVDPDILSSIPQLKQDNVKDKLQQLSTNNNKTLQSQIDQLQNVLTEGKLQLIAQFLRIDPEVLKKASMSEIIQLLQQSIESLKKNPHTQQELDELNKMVAVFQITEQQLEQAQTNIMSESQQLMNMQNDAQRLMLLKGNHQLAYSLETVGELNNLAKFVGKVRHFGVQVEYGKMLDGDVYELSNDDLEHRQNVVVDGYLSEIKPSGQLLDDFKRLYITAPGANVFERLFNMSRLVKLHHQQRVDQYLQETKGKYNKEFDTLASSLIFGVDFLFEVGIDLPERVDMFSNTKHLAATNLQSKIGDSQTIQPNHFITDLQTVDFEQPEPYGQASLIRQVKPLGQSHLNKMNGYQNRNIASSVNSSVSVVISNQEGFALPDINQSVVPLRGKTSVVNYRSQQFQRKVLSPNAMLSKQSINNPQFLEVKKI